MVILYRQNENATDNLYDILDSYEMKTITQAYNKKNNYSAIIVASEDINSEIADEISVLDFVVRVRVL